jgi:hypothetical protein
MIEAIDWLQANWNAIAAGLASLYAVVTVIVGLTPSTKDDDFLRRVAERLSLRGPSNSGTGWKLPGKAPKREDQ